MKYITQSHFKPRNGLSIDFSTTVISAGGIKDDEKKLQEMRPYYVRFGMTLSVKE
uniref:hypothetical protein n=1 Tax=Xenorhabdus sp. Sc-CR9 TaxID=2584468 RepID=UPI0030DC2869